MSWFRAFRDRLRVGRRPPTDPLTTDEASKAEEARQKTASDDQQAERASQEKPNGTGQRGRP